MSKPANCYPCRRGVKACPARPGNKSACRLSKDGTSAWSYGTQLFALLPGGTLLVNVTKYSVTTSYHQGHVQAWHLPDHKDRVDLDDVPRGTWSLENHWKRTTSGPRFTR